MRLDIKKRAQFSHGDFIVGFVIFSFALVLFFKYSDYVSPSNSSNDFLMREGKLITDSLLSEGYPSDWTAGNVVIAGITDGTPRINETKLLNLYNLSYSETKPLFKLRCEYYMYFTDNEDSVISISSKEGFGYPGITPSSLDSIPADDIAKTMRLVIYNSEIIKMVVVTW